MALSNMMKRYKLRQAYEAGFSSKQKQMPAAVAGNGAEGLAAFEAGKLAASQALPFHGAWQKWLGEFETAEAAGGVAANFATGAGESSDVAANWEAGADDGSTEELAEALEELANGDEVEPDHSPIDLVGGDDDDEEDITSGEVNEFGDLLEVNEDDDGRDDDDAN